MLSFLLGLLVALAPSQDAQKDQQAPARLPNGFYLIVRQDDAKDKLLPLAKDERLLVQDFRYMNAQDRPEPRFVVVRERPDVPLQLANAPKGVRGDNGLMTVFVDLARDQKETLARVTSGNVGKSVAIVIGGDVITTHTIRETITGGQIQISRCSDNGCEYLLRLLKEQ